ncbi:hypothetical protein FOBRF1_012112 [Fusarium oxysporum]
MDMAPPTTQLVPRKKYTRAKAPKVRTGCTTCKTRHLKCDEGKPACQRCKQDKLKCDGYVEVILPRKRVCRVAQSVPDVKKAHQGTWTPLRPAPNIDYHACPSDAALFYHARQCIMLDFEAFSGQEFWQDFVLPCAHSIEVVKYALCALGGAHRHFLVRNQKEPTQLTINAEIERVAIQKYNQAIMQLRLLMLDNSSITSIGTTLICCIVFIAIENLYGRYTNSIHHLNAGCQLLNSLRAEQRPKDAPPPSESPINSHHPSSTVASLASDIFWRMGQKVAAYTGDYVFTALHRASTDIDMGDPQKPFPSMSNAAKLMDHVTDSYDGFLLECGPETWQVQESPQSVPSAVLAFNARKGAMDLVRASFRVWSARFDLLKSRVRQLRLSSTEHQQFALLSVHQTVWASLTKLETMEDDFGIEDAENIMDRVEILINVQGNKPQPVFAFDGYMVPVLSLVCSSCREPRIQRRAIALLRALRRREGVWDSLEVADIYEYKLALQNRNRVDWDSLPWGIPQLATDLSCVSISDTSSSSPA